MSFRCSQLTKSYPVRGGEVIALKGIDFSVAELEFVCIVGPSGCGKTTLLKIIAGLIKPTSGRIVFSDHTSQAGPVTAMVFQDLGLFPWMTVIDNVAFGLETRGMGLKQRRTLARNFIKRFGLKEFRHNYPHELSGGMRQRVAILRAFLTDPQILLMDEPFGSLDSQTRMVMQDELLRIWKDNRKTVIYVTHDIDEAILLGDRVLVLSGRPGMIHADITIPLPRPRQIEDRDLPEFVMFRKQIWKMIEAEVRRELGAAP
jgi:NitT/TauT family transport system ATP-binding protein